MLFSTGMNMDADVPILRKYICIQRGAGSERAVQINKNEVHTGDHTAIKRRHPESTALLKTLSSLGMEKV